MSSGSSPTGTLVACNTPTGAAEESVVWALLQCPVWVASWSCPILPPPHGSSHFKGADPSRVHPSVPGSSRTRVRQPGT